MYLTCSIIIYYFLSHSIYFPLFLRKKTKQKTFSIGSFLSLPALALYRFNFHIWLNNDVAFLHTYNSGFLVYLFNIYYKTM